LRITVSIITGLKNIHLFRRIPSSSLSRICGDTLFVIWIRNRNFPQSCTGCGHGGRFIVSVLYLLF